MSLMTRCVCIAALAALLALAGSPVLAEQAAAPAKIKVPAADADGSFTIKWQKSPTPAVTYLLQETTDPTLVAESWATVAGPTEETGATLSGRGAGVTYFYRVKALHPDYADSDWLLGTVGCAVPGTKLPKPAAIGFPVSAEDDSDRLPAVDADGGYAIRWMAAAGTPAGVNYLLEEATDSKFTAGLLIVYSGTGTEALVNGRSVGMTYYYRVKAVQPGYRDSSWRSVGNKGITVIGEGVELPPPTRLKVPSGDADGTFTIKWKKSPTKGVAYLLQETIDPSQAEEKWATVAGPTVERAVTLIDKPLAATYFYRIKAVHPEYVDSSWETDHIGCAVPGTPLETPASLTVPATSDGSHTPSWSALALHGVTYVLEEAVDAKFTTGLETVYTGPDTAVTLSGRSVGTIYYYRVKAVKPGYRESAWRQAANGVEVLPPPGPGDTELYFPNDIGDTWTFNLTEKENGFISNNDLTRMTVTGTRPVLGQLASVFTESAYSGPAGSTSIEYYFAKDLGGVTNLGNNDPEDPLTPQLVPYTELRFPVQVGVIADFSRTGLNFGVDLDGDGKNEKVDLDFTSAITGSGSVQVPAGNFEDAGRRLTTIDGVIKLTKYKNYSVPITISEETWAAPGAGAVQRATTTAISIFDPNGNLLLSESMEVIGEARGYTVGGVRHGLGWPVTLRDDLSPGDGYMPVPIGQPVVAGDGTNFLVMTRKATRDADGWIVHWVGTLVDREGAILTAFDATPPTRSTAGEQAALAFDGSNYLFVYEQDNNFASSGLHPSLAAVRISPAGDLLGNSVEVAPSGATSSALACDGSNCLLVFNGPLSDQIFGLPQIAGAFIDPATGMVTPQGIFPIAPDQGYQDAPAVAFDGTNYLVVWDQGLWEATGQSPGIYAARVARNGTVLDPASFPVIDTSSLPIWAQAQGNPALAFDGENYLVLYQHTPIGQDIQLAGMRITPNGELLDGSPVTGGFPVTTNTEGFAVSPVLTYATGEYWAAWVYSPAIGVYDGIYGGRIGTDGEVLSPGVAGMRMGPIDYALYPAITADPAGGFLVWLKPTGASVPYSAGGLPIDPFEP